MKKKQQFDERTPIFDAAVEAQKRRFDEVAAKALATRREKDEADKAKQRDRNKWWR